MIDRALLRTDPDSIRKGLRDRGMDDSVVDRMIALDRRVRELARERDELRRLRKEKAKAFHRASLK